ncbi:hypothetical protein H5410_043339 [Solanum commersonii]|uniref:Uncharacterized protein n=1 Tax=Solanum commersonii TaxID=4109 RepID=A0A9J5XXA0_SOLCO|nr:hypothetical protein H5410_043339 [Solanum commersonii]
MVELLQLKYQTSNTSPFEIHPIKMYLAIVSFLIYSFAYDAQIKNISTTCSNYAKMVGDIFGSLALASYSSLLYPPFSFFFYSLSILYSATQLLNQTLLHERLTMLYHKFIKYISTTYSNYAKVVGDIFGSLSLASYSSLLYPPFSFIFYSLSILYSATHLLNKTLRLLYHKLVNYFNEPITTIV